MEGRAKGKKRRGKRLAISRLKLHGLYVVYGHMSALGAKHKTIPCKTAASGNTSVRVATDKDKDGSEK